MHRTALMTAVAAAAALATTTGAMATASTATAPRPAPATVLARGLVSPLSTAVAPNGTAYISENFAGMLVKKVPGKRLRTLYRAPKGTEVGGVSLRRGVVTFTKTGRQKTLNRISPSGRVTRVANVGAFEANHNPDAHVVYGFRHISEACAAQVPEEFGPAKYHGLVDSHPYGTTRVGRATYVAEAAGNDILKVARGRISTLAVLPPVKVHVTPEAAQATGMPACVVGLDYWFEPVPTDVERGPGRNLYVSTLTGGPEDGSLGALSRLYRVNRSSGAVHLVAEGLAGATGVAVAPDGDAYVAELYGGRIEKVAAGTSHATPVRGALQPAAIEYVRGHLYATTHVLSDPPAGRLIRFRP